VENRFWLGLFYRTSLFELQGDFGPNMPTRRHFAAHLSVTRTVSDNQRLFFLHHEEKLGW
jgi:hypothetical protein